MKVFTSSNSCLKLKLYLKLYYSISRLFNDNVRTLGMIRSSLDSRNCKQLDMGTLHALSCTVEAKSVVSGSTRTQALTSAPGRIGMGLSGHVMLLSNSSDEKRGLSQYYNTCYLDWGWDWELNTRIIQMGFQTSFFFFTKQTLVPLVHCVHFPLITGKNGLKTYNYLGALCLK